MLDRWQGVALCTTCLQVTDKKGDVDIKLKDAVCEFARDFRDSASQRLVVILSGESVTCMHVSACDYSGGQDSKETLPLFRSWCSWFPGLGAS